MLKSFKAVTELYQPRKQATGEIDFINKHLPVKEIDGRTKGGTDPGKAKPGTERAVRIADTKMPSEVSSGLDEALRDYTPNKNRTKFLHANGSNIEMKDDKGGFLAVHTDTKGKKKSFYSSTQLSDHLRGLKEDMDLEESWRTHTPETPVHLFKAKHSAAEEEIYNKHNPNNNSSEIADSHSMTAKKHTEQKDHAVSVLKSLPAYQKSSKEQMDTHRAAQDSLNYSCNAEALHKNAAAHHSAKSPHAHLASMQADTGASHDADHYHETLKTRLRGLKEELELDELSKKTVGSYINHATKYVDERAYDLGHRDSKGENPKTVQPLEKVVSRRLKGIARAVRKLTKENFNTEAHKKFDLNSKEVLLDTHRRSSNHIMKLPNTSAYTIDKGHLHTPSIYAERSSREKLSKLHGVEVKKPDHKLIGEEV